VEIYEEELNKNNLFLVEVFSDLKKKKQNMKGCESSSLYNTVI
jgi:hypothetical protein